MPAQRRYSPERAGFRMWDEASSLGIGSAAARFNPAFDLSLGLVVSTSAITSVVISRILQRSGLQTFTEAPEQSAARLLERRPCVVIADAGPRNEDCRDLVEAVTGMRRAAGTGLPLLVLITAINTDRLRVDPGGTVNAVVARPITPEALQPIVEILLEPFRV